MGQQVVLTETFTDTTLPVIYPDPRVGTGTLFLADLGHSAGGVAGVPVAGSGVPNVAYRSAASLIGGGTAATLAGITRRTDIAATHKVERSSKGGLHAIYTATGDTVGGGHSVSIDLPDLIKQYVLNNPTHAFYFSQWHTVTRAVTGSNTGAQAGVHSLASPATAFSFYIRPTSNAPNPTANFKSGAVPAKNTVGPTFEYMATPSFTGTTPATAAALAAYAWQSGPGEGFATATYTNTGWSDIFYAALLEDLTVSGRTYSQVQAIDQALFNTAFAAGGKFYGDTYTAPSTLP